MFTMSRRSLLWAGGAAWAAQKFTKPLYVQTYTLRNQLPDAPRETLAAVAKLGYAGVEAGRAELSKLAPYFKEFKLSTPSAHFEAPLITGNWDAYKPLQATLPAGYDLSRAIAGAEAAGLKFMVVPYLQKSERTAPGFYSRFADQMNRAGEAVRKAGMQLAYHHHSFEFEPVNGKRPFDLLAERFDPQLVHWELDFFWLAIGGDDPVARLKQFKGRVAAVHLKDIARGVKTEYWEGATPKTAFKEVGSGSLDWPAVLSACEAAGVSLYIVEQDQCPGNPLDSIAQSYNYLRGVLV